MAIDPSSLPAGRRPLSIETRITLILVSVALVGLTTLALLHPRTETVSFNLNTGELRLERFLYGFPYSRETITSHLEWIHDSKGDTGDQWVDASRRHTGAPLRRGVYQRRIGQVYTEAFTIAPLVQPDPARLRLLLRQIAGADTQRIWDLRQDLRRSLDVLQASRIRR